ncbi:MAG: response regulator [Isosphaeraceae bacterium]|nr:response regulator [Isosphaeraceae bacterium]
MVSSNLPPRPPSYLPPLDRSRPADQAEARFRTLIEANADGMLVVRLNGSIAFVNPAACALLGREAEALIGASFGIPIVPGETAEVDLPFRGDRIRIAELRVAQIEWEGEPAYLAALRDITDRKRMEEQLRRQSEQLAEADRRKDEFLAMLAHELRNPLAAIQNAVQVLRGSDTPEQRAWGQEVIERQVKHLARLLDDLLDISRITRGKIQLRTQRLDLTPIIHRAVESVRPLIEGRRHELTIAIAPGPLWLEADPTRLEQVLVNLLTNAAKYTEEGGRIELTAQYEGKDIVIAVRDTGIGLTPEMLSRIFELFVQAERALDRSQGGLGIGLTLVKSLVELHGGHIEAHSAGLGCGSEFIVWLPAAGAPSTDHLGPKLATPTAAPRGYRVLVVDDNMDTARGLSRLLKLSGHDVRIVHDGQAALEAARAYRPEVVLLDIGLPHLDGYQVAAALRREEGLRSTRIIAISGYGQEEDRRRSKAAGCDHHLIKPIDYNALLALFEPASSASLSPV